MISTERAARMRTRGSHPARDVPPVRRTAGTRENELAVPLGEFGPLDAGTLRDDEKLPAIRGPRSSERTTTEATRAADVYVFCVFSATEKPADPLDLAHWFFLVCCARELDRRFGKQKSVALSSLEAAGCRRVGFDHLRLALEAAIAARHPP